MTGFSVERAHHMRLNELRRQAYVIAQIRQAQGAPLARFATALRRLASRLDAARGAAAGPWREDFTPAASGRA